MCDSTLCFVRLAFYFLSSTGKHSFCVVFLHWLQLIYTRYKTSPIRRFGCIGEVLFPAIQSMEFFTNRQRANGFVAGFCCLHRCTSRWLCCCYAQTIPECIFGLFPIPIGGWNSCAPTNADWPVLGCQPFAGFALTPVANCVRCIFRPLAAIPLELNFGSSNKAVLV